MFFFINVSLPGHAIYKKVINDSAGILFGGQEKVLEAIFHQNVNFLVKTWLFDHVLMV